MKRFKRLENRFGKRFTEGKNGLFFRLNRAREHVNNLQILVLGLFLAIVFLLFELFLRIYDLYKVTYWVDVPSHFFGGMALASLALVLIYLTKIRKKNFFTISFVFISALIWEILETVGELIFPNQPIYLRDYFMWDGFWDIIITVTGGITFLVIFNKYIRSRLQHRLKSI